MKTGQFAHAHAWLRRSAAGRRCQEAAVYDGGRGEALDTALEVFDILVVVLECVDLDRLKEILA
jgi:hypothetical protein